MNRIDRLMGMLTLLQSREFVTAPQLAQQFEISVRTVYRDIRAFGEIGIPLGYENNKGYFIVQGYFLPPVSFTSEEANALLLIDTLVHRFVDQSAQKHYQRALNKIKATLKGSQKAALETLQSQIRTLKHEDGPNIDYLSTIQAALGQRHILKIDYQNYDQQRSQREIEPIGLIFYDLNWHVIAWCWLRHSYRDFKVSRILGLELTAIPFRKSEHVAISQYIPGLESYLNGLP